jgi:hypothetical protein
MNVSNFGEERRHARADSCRRQAIRRHVATRRADGQQPGKVSGPPRGQPGAARPRPRPWTGTDAGIPMRTSPATPGAPGPH